MSRDNNKTDCNPMMITNKMGLLYLTSLNLIIMMNFWN